MSRGSRPAQAAGSILPLVALLALVLAAHASGLAGGFVWDDDDYIVENPVLRESGGLARIWFDLGATPQYYPLVFSTFWLETRAFGFSPLGFHAVNLALHAGVVLLLWRLLRALGVPGAWLGAALFGVHPITIESVAWVTERKNTLSAVFLVSATLAYLRASGLAPPDRSDRARMPVDRRAYAIACICFVAALLSKTVSAVFPGLVLLLVWWKRGRLDRRDLFLVAPLFVLGLAAGSLTVWLERHHVGAQGVDWALSAADRVVLAGRVLWFYVSKLVAPIELSFIYPRWNVDAGNPTAWFAPLAWGLLLALLAAARRRIGSAPLVAFLAFTGCLFPALGFFDVYPMRYSWVADHFQYHAAPSLLALAGAGLAKAVARRSSLLRPVVAGLLLGLALLSFQRGQVYGDIASLWEDTLARNPRAWMAQHNLGLVHERAGRLEEAMHAYRATLEIREDLGQAHYNLGSLLAAKGRFEEARTHLESAVRLEPSLLEARNNLGNVYLRLGRLDDAIEAYRGALRLQPSYASAQRNLMFALQAKERATAQAPLSPGQPLR